MLYAYVAKMHHYFVKPIQRNLKNVKSSEAHHFITSQPQFYDNPCFCPNSSLFDVPVIKVSLV